MAVNKIRTLDTLQSPVEPVTCHRRGFSSVPYMLHCGDGYSAEHMVLETFLVMYFDTSQTVHLFVKDSQLIAP